MRHFLLMFSFVLALPLLAETRVVVVAPDGTPLPGATVQVVANGEPAVQQVTGPEGAVTVDVPSAAEVRVELDGFSPATLALVPGQSLRVELQLAGVSEEITVSGLQSRVPLAEVSSSVTVVDAEELGESIRTSATLADALGKVVPGLSPGSGSASIYGQTIRGRSMQILVDGIPLTTLRNTSRDLVSIDPSMVERVEVLRGTTALYGDGATGGLINIITRQPERGSMQFATDLSFASSLSHAQDSAGARLTQSITGGANRFDWRADISVEQTGAAFDADGDRIPADPYGQGGVAESDSYSILAKAGFATTDDSRLTLSATTHNVEQDTEWTTDPSVNSLPARSVKSRAIRGVDFDHPQGSDNRLLQLAWEDRSLLGSTVRTQAYLREYETVFTPFDGRNLAIYGHQIFQSRLESESRGLRADVQTPLPLRGVTLYWGLDAGSEKTAQPVWIIDPAVYDQSGGRTFRAIDDRPWVPLIDKQNQAAFAQLEWMASERWLLRGGVRHDRVQADIPTFSTLANATIEGGAREFSDTLVNAGVVYYVRPRSRVFLSYSEGFSLPDIGLVLRSAPANASLDTLPFAPQIVEGWELGWSTERGPLDWSVATFYSTAELGTSTAGFNQPIVRAPERVYGVEADFAFRASERWSTGANASWTEGKSDPNRDGIYTYLNNYRVAAPNASVWLEHQTTRAWSNRIQMLWSGDRDRFGTSTAFGERPIESYQVVDLLSSFNLSRGVLTIGVQNLLNERYFVRDAQLLRSGRNDSHAAAPGTILRLGWSIRY
jgi:iron complex outermembrane receptor protein